jgi:hypothetical protein
MFGSKDDNRFETVYKQDGFGTMTHIIKDRDTGVCYLFVARGEYGGGLTPLIDRDGKPVTM